MIESRLATVFLLNGNQIDFIISPTLLSFELIEMVSTHLQLKDKEYFGLSFIDITGHRNWLQADKRVLEHDFPKKNGILVLYFSVKFYVENIAFCKDRKAVELFFMQSKQAIYKNELDVHNDIIFELAALVLQSLLGDYKADIDCLKYLTSQQLLPDRLISNPKSTKYCEQKVIGYYKKCAGMNRGQSIVNYLTIIEKLPNYGVHFYEVKDKSNSKWFLGISFRGIGLYEVNNRMTCKKLFPWCQLENLYYRERKFSIEVHEAFNSEGRAADNEQTNNNKLQTGPGSGGANEDGFNQVKVYAWFTSIASLCKSIWLMAVAQHQFHLDKKQNKANILQYKSLNDLALELCNPSVNFYNSEEQVNTNVSENGKNLLEYLYEKNGEYKQDLLLLNKKRKEILQRRLGMKKSELEEVSFKADEIAEISKNLLNKDTSNLYMINRVLMDFQTIISKRKLNYLNELEMEYNIQREILLTSLSMASDPNTNLLALKKRRDLYEKEKKKFWKLDCKLQHERGIFEMEQYNMAEQNERNMNMDQFKVELSNISSDQQTNGGANDGSPISIHRKNSYRLAQEQKLFLESNSNAGNKTTRNVMSRKVKPINTNMNQPNGSGGGGINSIFSNGSVGDSNNHHNSTTSSSSNGGDEPPAVVNGFNSHHHHQQLMTNSMTTNGMHTIHEPVRLANHVALSQQQPPYVMVSSSAKPSPTHHFVVHKAELRSSPIDVIESHHDKVFINNLYDSKVLTREVSSSNGAIHHVLSSNELKYRSTSSNEMAASMDNNYADSDTTNSQESQHSYPPPLPPTSKFVTNNENKAAVDDSTQFCDGTDYKRYSSSTTANYSDKNAAILFNNLDHSSNVNFMRRNNNNSQQQRKNTSDSNVKLLADHNFYHVTNKLPTLPLPPSHENSLNREDSLSTSSENYEEYEKTRIIHQSHSHPQSLKGITATMPEYYTTTTTATTYNNGGPTYRSSNTTSSNSLVGLRENKSGQDELTTTKYTKTSDKLVGGPNFTSQIIGEKYHNHHHNHNEINDINSLYYDHSSNGYKRVSAADYTNGSDKRRNDMTSTSSHQQQHLTSTPPTNTSLNLSIHTAEEFGMEMLEWLNNENKLSNHHIANGGTGGGGSNPIANNATLV